MQGGTLTYNGITLALVKTNNLLAEPVWTDDRVDYLYTHFIIDIDAILNPQQTAYAGNPPVLTPGTLPPDTYATIRHYLMQPRCALAFTNFGRNVVVSPQVGDTIDANNGPIPLNLTIRRIDGAQVYHVRYSIETWLLECPNGPPSPYLSNRYSQSQSINREFYTTSVTQGTAYFATDLLQDANQVADAFRNLLLPPVPLGFQRTDINFKVNTQGNAIAYEIRDLEKPYDLGDTGASGSGSYVTNADGFYTNQTIQQSTEQGGLPGPRTLATMNVKLWGSKQASNWNLTQIAFQIMGASGKLPFALPNVGYIHHISITQSITERFVDVTVAMILNPVENGPFGGMRVSGLQKDQVFTPFGGVNPGPPNDNATRGTASIQLLSAALTTACASPPAPLQATGGGGQAPTPYGGPPPAISVTPTDTIPSQPDRYTPDTTTFPYTDATISSSYETNQGTYQAPIAQDPGGSITTTSSIMTLHLPFAQRRVRWTVERVNAVPKIPSWQSSDTNQVIKSWRIDPLDIEILPDGQSQVYRVSGEYVYAMKSPPSFSLQIPFDIPQWVNLPYGQPVINLPSVGQTYGGDVSHGIIDPGP